MDRMRTRSERRHGVDLFMAGSVASAVRPPNDRQVLPASERFPQPFITKNEGHEDHEEAFPPKSFVILRVLRAFVICRRC
jgi:hypothetical protein